MIIIVVSQKAIPTKDFRLRDLPGHGRIDIMMRCILAARRPLPSAEPARIFCFLKGGDPTGWISWENESDLVDEDEVSIAGKIRGNWDKYFTAGTLNELLALFGSRKVITLTTNGIDVSKIDISQYQDSIVVFGAQIAPSKEDKDILNPHLQISLGRQALLASHAITLYRQLILQPKRVI